jgi:hypothetical protein
LLPLLMLVAVASAHAEPLTAVFGGETYTLAFEHTVEQPAANAGEGLAEFTLKGETVEDWSKLFAYHAYPQIGDDPVAAVKTLGKVIKETNKDANFAIIEDPKTGEAIIDFLTWVPGGEGPMEFNVFKYAKAKDGPGLVAIQFAQHVTPDEVGVEGMRELREKSVQYMADTDIDQAREYFADTAKKADADGADEGNSTDDDGAAQAGGAGADR